MLFTSNSKARKQHKSMKLQKTEEVNDTIDK